MFMQSLCPVQMNKVLDNDLCECVNVSFYRNIYSSTDDGGSLPKRYTGLKSSIITAFLNPYVIPSSVTSQLVIKYPDISVKTGDNLINLMKNVEKKPGQLVNSKLSKNSTNLKRKQTSLLCIEYESKINLLEFILVDFTVQLQVKMMGG